MMTFGFLNLPLGGGPQDRRLGTLAHDSLQQRFPYHYPEVRRLCSDSFHACFAQG